MMESGDTDGAFLRDLIECLADFRVRPSLRNAEVTSRSNRARNPQAKVAVRKVNTSPVFRYERVVVPDLVPNGLDFLPCARSKQNERDFSTFQFRQGFFRTCK